MSFIAPLFAFGSAAAPAAGAVAGAATTGVSALSILSGAASVIGVLGSLASANAQADSMREQAAQVELDAKREDNLGLQRRTAMKRELLTVLGQNDVNAAAAGIDISSGIAQDMNESAETAAATELSVDRADQNYRAAQLRARAANLRSQATAVRKAGALTAAGGILQSGITMYNRG
ncbi:hypothetical protein [Ancylobacter oerskovii]|uniref:Uncharacterized protein n=1 Tax=Ancylobacter oerskovii TaxID=459519 RepID=A0ABW4YRM8_9HYPH|nr:hypothetical protein [Ancylobacter oerskovii]MBS7545691.1 hypothetical protein [Ancylobacter oerskovii]